MWHVASSGMRSICRFHFYSIYMIYDWCGVTVIVAILMAMSGSGVWAQDRTNIVSVPVVQAADSRVSVPVSINGIPHDGPIYLMQAPSTPSPSTQVVMPLTTTTMALASTAKSTTAPGYDTAASPSTMLPGGIALNLIV